MSIRSIAIDASRASSFARTGTEWYSFELIRALAQLQVRPPLVFYDRQRVPSVPPGQLDEHRVIRMPRLWTHVGLSTAMLKDRPSALFVPSHVIPVIHPPVTVVTIHDIGFRSERTSHPRASRVMLELATRWNARAAKSIIAVSNQTKNDLTREYGVAGSKITVIHSGLNHLRFHPVNPDRSLRALGLRQPYILFLSTVHPRKNLFRLIEAFERIDSDELQLVVAGKPGWMHDAIDARIEISPARRRISRLGFVPDEHIPALYSGAEVFALPSLYEGFGFGILEAMACGTPVVTSDRSSMPEIAGDAAVFVNPFDTQEIQRGLERALKPDERHRLVSAGLDRASGFTWERTACQTLEVIESSMSG